MLGQTQFTFDVWGHTVNAASRIGDDALQRASGGAVVPESFTHGSSAQRQRWFATGLKTGSVKACDTFSARNL